MKRLIAVLAGLLGLRALLRRRARAAEGPPVDELRAKLAESRAAEEQPPDAEPGAPDVDARRAEVHERARQAIDELGEP
jgi:hypothetical protein